MPSPSVFLWAVTNCILFEILFILIHDACVKSFGDAQSFLWNLATRSRDCKSFTNQSFAMKILPQWNSEYAEGLVINNPLEGNRGTQLEAYSMARIAIYFECNRLTASPCFSVNYARNRIANILLLMKDCGNQRFLGRWANLILASWSVFFLQGWLMAGIIFHHCVPLDLGFCWAIKIEELIIVSCRYSP